ncbi:MAG: hypothetical protein AB7U98_00440 [Candidatus Nitrosocosmicus sp.]
MDITNSFIMAIAMASILLIVQNMEGSIRAQTPIATDRLVNIINETNSDSTVDVLNKSLPAKNATKVVPVNPM